MLDNSRQEGLISEELLNSTRVIIIGVGAGGSWTAYFLAKLGVKDIHLYDFDTVGQENIRSQCFGLNDVGKLKTIALKERLNTELNINPVIYNTKIDENTVLDVNLNTIVLNLVDSIETRQLVYNKLKGMPIRMIDARMGGEGWEVYSIDCSNLEQQTYYEESLKGVFREQPCGQKAVIYSTVSEVCEIINLVKKHIKQEGNELMIRREMKKPFFLVKDTN